MTDTLILKRTDLVHDRGPYVEAWQRVFNHTRSQKHYAKLREVLHLKIEQDNERASK